MNERRRLEQRDAVAELIDAGLSYVVQFEALVVGIAKLDDPTQAPRDEMAGVKSRYGKALGIASLTVTERNLQDHAWRLVGEFRRDDLVGPILRARLMEQSHKDGLDRALKYARSTEDRLKRLESTAVQVFTAID